MAEYIDRDLTEKALMERCNETGYGGLNRTDVKMVMRTPWRIPPADVVERKHGKWVDMYDGWVCTACNEKNDYSKLFNFCPTCGADMRGEDDV